MNKVLLIGKLENKEMKKSQGGKDFAVLTVRVNLPDWMKKTETHEICLFSKQLEKAALVQVGQIICIEGCLTSQKNDKGYTNLKLLVSDVTVPDKVFENNDDFPF